MIVTTFGRLRPKLTSTKRDPIEIHTLKADIVIKVMALLIQVVRLIIMLSSLKYAFFSFKDISLMMRARSTALPNRLTSTDSIEPMPVIKKTGATAL